MYKFEESFKEENGKVYFLKERMQEIVGNYDLDRCENWKEFESKATEIIQEEITSTSRWSVHKECVFKFNDRFFRTHYSEGATEIQDESPFEYDGEWVEVDEVEPKEVTVIQYVSKGSK